MNNFEVLLEKMDRPFYYAMENEKLARYDAAYEAIVDTFKLKKFLEESDNAEMLQTVIQKFYELGYYGGINFIMDPDNKYPIMFNKLYEIKNNKDGVDNH